jgi:hypothetical protein
MKLLFHCLKCCLMPKGIGEDWIDAKKKKWKVLLVYMDQK